MPLLSSLAVPVAFVLTSPFVLLRVPQVVEDLLFEARGDHPGADGLSFTGNVAYYLGQAVPADFSPILLVLAAAGAVILARTNGRAIAVLGAFAASYLVGISAAPLHWERYVIPLAPLVGIGVAAAVLTIADVAVAWVSGRRRGRTAAAPGGTARPDEPGRETGASRSPAAVVIACVIVGLLVLPSVASIVEADRLRARPSTRVVASDWIRDNLPADGRVAAEMYTSYRGVGGDVLRVATLGDRAPEHLAGRRLPLPVVELGDRPIGTWTPGDTRTSCELRCARGVRPPPRHVPARPGSGGSRDPRLRAPGALSSARPVAASHRAGRPAPRRRCRRSGRRSGGTPAGR